MAQSIEFKVDEKALAGLRSLPAVKALISSTVESWCEEANATLAEGVGYRSAVHEDSSRRGPYVVGRVYTSSNHAKNSNAKYDTLARIVNR